MHGSQLFISPGDLICVKPGHCPTLWKTLDEARLQSCDEDARLCDQDTVLIISVLKRILPYETCEPIFVVSSKGMGWISASPYFYDVFR
jgi:hypothetical protein